MPGVRGHQDMRWLLALIIAITSSGAEAAKNDWPFDQVKNTAVITAATDHASPSANFACFTR